jgi:hydroxyacylglutathione hydrolase
MAALAVLLACGALSAGFAPYLYSEYALREAHEVVGPKPAGLVSGRWYDDYFVIETIDESTFAIGEPRYYQGNYSYLIVGSASAVLFDAGTGTRDIVPVVRSLTKLPVTVVPSHLHFDHVGALGRFEKTALIDDPSLRLRAPDGNLTLRRYEFLGFGDNLRTPSFRVDQWWKPDTVIDLGERVLQLLATPGHTPTSVSLLDRRRRQIFVGDFIYPGPLYAQLPGASREDYRTTTARLLAIAGPDTRIFTAHMAQSADTVRAPVLEVHDLQALANALSAIDSGNLLATGIYPRVYPVQGDLTFLIGFRWNNR